MHIQPHSQVRNQGGGEGLPCCFLKIEKSALILEKRPSLCPSLVICTVTLSYALDQTHSESWHIKSFDYLAVFRHIQNILRIIKAYSCVLSNCYGIFRLIQTYSEPLVTLTYSQPCHNSSPGMFRSGGLFKTL